MLVKLVNEYGGYTARITEHQKKVVEWLIDCGFLDDDFVTYINETEDIDDLTKEE